MTQKSDFSIASSDAIISDLCKRLDAIRLSRNISQAALAEEAGVSRSTMTRLADGQAISLDSFVRVMMALQLTDQLALLLPEPGIRPVEQVRRKSRERQRASRKTREQSQWTWGDGQK